MKEILGFPIFRRLKERDRVHICVDGKPNKRGHVNDVARLLNKETKLSNEGELSYEESPLASRLGNELGNSLEPEWMLIS